MNITPDDFEEEDEDTWTIQSVNLTEPRNSISLTVFSESGKPSSEMTERIQKSFSDLDALILDAATHILDNYSYEHFKKLGVPEERLVPEDVTAVAAAVVLQSIYVFNPDENGFEMSFTAPWDDHHSFDVEFEDGKVITCAVNG